MTAIRAIGGTALAGLALLCVGCGATPLLAPPPAPVHNAVNVSSHKAPRVATSVGGETVEFYGLGPGGVEITEQEKDGVKQTLIRPRPVERVLVCKDYSNSFKYRNGRKYSTRFDRCFRRYRPLPIGGAPVICDGCSDPACQTNNSFLYGFLAGRRPAGCRSGCQQGHPHAGKTYAGGPGAGAHASQAIQAAGRAARVAQGDFSGEQKGLLSGDNVKTAFEVFKFANQFR